MILVHSKCYDAALSRYLESVVTSASSTAPFLVVEVVFEVTGLTVDETFAEVVSAVVVLTVLFAVVDVVEALDYTEAEVDEAEDRAAVKL